MSILCISFVFAFAYNGIVVFCDGCNLKNILIQCFVILIFISAHCGYLLQKFWSNFNIKALKYAMHHFFIAFCQVVIIISKPATCCFNEFAWYYFRIATGGFLIIVAAIQYIKKKRARQESEQ